METPQRITPQLLAVLRVLVDQEDGEQLYGRAVAEKTGLTSGVVTLIFKRLAALGWLSEEWEALDSRTARPRRKYVSLTPQGREASQRVLVARTATRGK
ncbi:helix-turn-helix transcriptional regulator [Plantactinospora sp. S1510]|uniref:Helix-turn-helix transcriptional regulator n=1 Tax=Plantactinospora alkalitolerans TaxID=2789879 RepID=A0ABS0HA84_9ACTN|nr:helix-turn-helix transcriptional regulator [Plantactinospora alkalitolerans]MBF9135239.1 helix-turn-helix transcriptional regulator [Plantactinospora alkalitolerans]